MSSPGLNLELALDISPRLVSVARRFIEEVVERMLDDSDVASRVAMTAHELLENAAKYSSNGRAVLRLRAEGVGEARRVVVSLTNQTTATHRERLVRGFAEISAAGDPYDLYFELMRRDLAHKEASGLGLARIWAEGEMQLALETRDETVVILAAAPAPERGAS